MGYYMPLLVAVLFVAPVAAEGVGVNAVGDNTLEVGGDFAQNVDKEGVDEYVKSLQGRTIVQMVEKKSIIDDGFLQQNKEQVLQIWKETINTPYDPGPQIIMEHLARTNLGILSDSEVVILPAPAKFLGRSVPGLTAYSYNEINGIDAMRAWSIRDVPGATQQTVGSNNVGEKYQNKAPFRNELTGKAGVIPKEEMIRLRAENKNCIGTFTSSTGENLPRDQIYRCFVTLNTPFIKVLPKGGYLDALDLQTSIINVKDGTHSCMASYYRDGLWITAAHCLSEANVLSGRSILSSGKPVVITKDRVHMCGSPGCDVAFVNAPTPAIDAAKYELIKSDLSRLTEKSRIFIPGMEEGMSVVASDKSAYKNNLMWSDVGKGFCRIYRVQNGCFSHTCSTLSGFSGAPVYWVDAPGGKIELLGIHSGESVDGISCSETGSNYAVASGLYNGAMK